MNKITKRLGHLENMLLAQSEKNVAFQERLMNSPSSETVNTLLSRHIGLLPVMMGIGDLSTPLMPKKITHMISLRRQKVEMKFPWRRKRPRYHVTQTQAQKSSQRLFPMM